MEVPWESHGRVKEINRGRPMGVHWASKEVSWKCCMSMGASIGHKHFHWSPIGFLWDFHGIAMSPWTSMRIPWGYSIPLGVPWGFHRASMVRPWNYSVPIGLSWDYSVPIVILELYTGFLWDFHGTLIGLRGTSTGLP